MERLKDRRDLSGGDAEIAALVRAAEPPPPSLALRARVRAGLAGRRSAPPTFRAWSLSFASLCVLIAVASAMAIWGHRWLAPSHAPPAPPSPPLIQPRQTPPATGTPPKPPTSSPPPLRPSSPPPPARHTPATPPPTVAPATPPARVEPNEPEALVTAGVRALRRDHAPERALQLFDDYLQRHPDGPLAEEALVGAMEAAAAIHDPRTAALARDYLARHPSGRFRATAQRILDEQQQ